MNKANDKIILQSEEYSKLYTENYFEFHKNYKYYFINNNIKKILKIIKKKGDNKLYNLKNKK